jgi:hypothetical protein
MYRHRVATYATLLSKEETTMELMANECNHQYEVSTYCGVKVCNLCDDHVGLVRCYCGWSLSGGDGLRELIDMGEVIDDPDDY